MSHALAPKMRIAITGATGLVGRAVYRHFRDKAGVETRRLSRTPSKTQDTHAVVLGDLGMARFDALLEGCHTLIHCAFAHVPGRYRGGEGKDPANFWDLNLGGTIRLLEDAKRLGVKRVLLFSSRAVFGVRQLPPGTQVDEAVTPEPDTHYGLQKLALEGLARLYSHEDLSVSVLRVTGIYGGPSQNHKWRSLFEEASKGLLPPGNRTATEVHLDTVVAAAVGLLDTDPQAVSGCVFNLSEIRVSQAEILNAAGFDSTSMPPAEALMGVELDSSRLIKLGLRLKGKQELGQEARRIRQELGL